MKYFNLDLTVLRSPEYIGADPVQRATWLSLMGWCCELENGGVIEGCHEWGARRWMQSCGVTDEEVKDDCSLWSWNGDKLVVAFYPTDKQEEVKERREIARENGRKGGRPKKPTLVMQENQDVQTEKTNVGYEEKPTLEPMMQSGKERERKEKGIGKEEEEKEYTMNTMIKDCPPSLSDVVTSAASFFPASWTEEMSKCAAKYLDDRSAVGWMGKNGLPLRCWKSDFKLYAQRWAQNVQNNGGLTGARVPVNANRRNANASANYHTRQYDQ